MPRADGKIELWPLVRDLEHFAFRGLPYRGHRLDVFRDRPDGQRAHADTPEGFTLAVDGARAFSVPELRRMVVDG